MRPMSPMPMIPTEIVSMTGKRKGGLLASSLALQLRWQVRVRMSVRGRRLEALERYHVHFLMLLKIGFLQRWWVRRLEVRKVVQKPADDMAVPRR